MRFRHNSVDSLGCPICHFDACGLRKTVEFACASKTRYQTQPSFAVAEVYVAGAVGHLIRCWPATSNVTFDAHRFRRLLHKLFDLLSSLFLDSTPLFPISLRKHPSRIREHCHFSPVGLA